ncbi:hypothetical protein FAGAP_7137 [Fusarium agapanthi]|uniref:Uncharacterized protein n=1 Tax=Fusarium agapanthi TaxID=1803897 RepID=A0A9P5B887_9HYPO|nr:hypothetical protein FAGAP_7137 [Fusarium agapanthi]
MCSGHSSPAIGATPLPVNYGNLQAMQQAPFVVPSTPVYQRNSMLLPTQLPSQIAQQQPWQTDVNHFAPPRAIPFCDWDFYLLASTPNTGVISDVSRFASSTGSSSNQPLTNPRPQTAYEPSYSEIDAKQGLEATDKTWQCPSPFGLPPNLPPCKQANTIKPAVHGYNRS